jgi:hypothetical protein
MVFFIVGSEEITPAEYSLSNVQNIFTSMSRRNLKAINLSLHLQFEAELPLYNKNKGTTYITTSQKAPT